VEAALRDAAKRLEAAGWQVEEVANTPPLAECARLQAMLWLAETRRPGPSAFEQEGDPDALIVSGYMEALSPPGGLPEFQSVLQQRLGILRQWLAFLETFPVVIMPVSGELPFPDHDDLNGLDRFRQIMAAQLPMIGLALLSLPGLTISTGLVGKVPVGVQVVGGRYREDVLLAAAEAIEAAGTPPAPIDPRG
jgi:amidase